MTRVHVIGAGGIGMQGLCSWLKQAGYELTCSDDRANIDGFVPESAPVPDVDFVVSSSAIKDYHPQYADAIARHIPVLRRSDLMKKLMNTPGISVTGSHGKSTTTSMIAYALKTLGAPVSFMVGAVLRNYGTTAEYVDGGICVVEADESDDSMNTMTNETHIITNITEEHMDYYKTRENYISRMRLFGDRCKTLFCHTSCREHITRNDAIWYGSGGDFYVTDWSTDANGSCFSIHTPEGEFDNFRIRLRGRHMIENCVVAIACLRHYGFHFDSIRDALAGFDGVKRRMEEFAHNGRIIIQDYGNHPNDIGAVISTISEIYNERQLYILWEPHKYSRIAYQDNFDRILKAFESAAHVTVLPVWAAGDSPIDGFTQDDLCAKISKSVPCSMINNDEIAQYVDSLPENCACIAFGSGGIYQLVNACL